MWEGIMWCICEKIKYIRCKYLLLRLSGKLRLCVHDNRQDLMNEDNQHPATENSEKCRVLQMMCSTLLKYFRKANYALIRVNLEGKFDR